MSMEILNLIGMIVFGATLSFTIGLFILGIIEYVEVKLKKIGVD